ncbi:hypothetical protein GCM10022402_28340 [Salinactinospora qingdaonensis]|uniref:Uncharacterized protein n=1 Tax=Salinactinospora qingdaonensis TaxID=702744 RepID=A0ABP7FV56_9ACTN
MRGGWIRRPVWRCEPRGVAPVGMGWRRLRRVRATSPAACLEERVAVAGGGAVNDVDMVAA